ncbi:MAG TPA: YHS domain-containing protein [Epulopiscium sp.]|nr:YHS domain-containing protein [Candidatus Epulonipiscium sp.]
MLAILGNVFVIMFLVGLFNFTLYAFKIRSAIHKHKDDPNVKGVKIVNGKVHVIEEDMTILEAEIKEEIKVLVTDPVCNKELEKASAFHVIRNGESHYFCSWDCREKFLEPVSEKHL